MDEAQLLKQQELQELEAQLPAQLLKRPELQESSDGDFIGAFTC